ncbi:hypothetical protein AL073_06290 [Loktanella sp. 1ANDIMAR09]|nr:hypothetical protein AL073_06290 [Loktanella sp. 1ANDIMAR09]
MSDENFEVLRRDMTTILLDLFSTTTASSDLWIGFSRGKPNFTKGGCYWNPELDEPSLSYSITLRAVDFLEEQGLVEQQKAKKGYAKYSSRIRPTDTLRKMFEELGFNWTEIETSDEVCDFVVKDHKKRVTSWPDPVGFDLQRALDNLRSINQNLQRTFINLNISDEALSKIGLAGSTVNDEKIDHDMTEEDEGSSHYPVEFSNRRLTRIFAMNSFTHGGRFYGGFWQRIPSEYRRYIEIDGAITVELDYSTIQPRILYASVGSIPPTDSYTLPDWDPGLRKVGKKLFSQLLNSAESSTNPKQWHRFAPALEPVPLPSNWSTIGDHAQNELRRSYFRTITGRDYS